MMKNSVQVKNEIRLPSFKNIQALNLIGVANRTIIIRLYIFLNAFQRKITFLKMN